MLFSKLASKLSRHWKFPHERPRRSRLVVNMQHVVPADMTFRQSVHHMGGQANWTLDGQKISPIAFFDSKTREKAFIQSMGLPTPRLYLQKTPVEQLAFPEVNSFVVKPDLGVGAHGIHILEKRGRDFFESFSSAMISETDLNNSLRAATKLRKRYKNWIIEERMEDADGIDPLVDYKFYCFRERVPLLLVKRNKPDRYSYVDDQLQFVDVGSYSQKPLTKVLPGNIEEMWSFASDVGRRLPMPFCRVDLFNTTKGIVVGELTPAPGRVEKGFNADWECRLLSELRDSCRERSAGEFEFANFSQD